VTVNGHTACRPQTSLRRRPTQDGIARFSVPTNAEYQIEAALTGFKKGRVKSVRLVLGTITEANGQVRQAPAPRVQMRLELAGPFIDITHR
jgi:hypothetical protein